MGKRPTSTLSHVDPLRLLGGLTVAEFLRNHWHKRPLLVRQAIAGFGTQLLAEDLKALAGDPDVESRLVRRRGPGWTVQYGPFAAEDWQALPKRNWSLLVSGVNHWLPAGDRLLDAFAFIPHARLDDLMVSYAPPGGGVGPHFDSYDVFLLQGLGTRRWEISAQQDLDLVEGAPLRILQRFTAEQSWVLQPGDLLYLPPKYAHNGVALSDCMTLSIGFRAPTAEEIASAFLADLQDSLRLNGRYADPDLQCAEHPGEIPGALLAGLSGFINDIRWEPAQVEDFIGRYLSEPKPNVYFSPPRRPLSAARFAAAAMKRGIRLDTRSRFLFSHNTFFINGESHIPGHALRNALIALADNRSLPPGPVQAALLELLYAWYRAGYLDLAAV